MGVVSGLCQSVRKDDMEFMTFPAGHFWEF